MSFYIYIMVQNFIYIPTLNYLPVSRFEKDNFYSNPIKIFKFIELFKYRTIKFNFFFLRYYSKINSSLIRLPRFIYPFILYFVLNLCNLTTDIIFIYLFRGIYGSRIIVLKCFRTFTSKKIVDIPGILILNLKQILQY